MGQPTLEYRTPEKRPIYSLVAASWALAAVAILLVTLWVSGPWLTDLSMLFASEPSRPTRAAAWLANALAFRRGMWLVCIGAAALCGFLGAARRNVAPPTNRRVIALLLWTLTVAIFMTAAIVSPVLQFARGLRPVRGTDGRVPCANWTAVYAFIAQQQGVGNDLNAALEIATHSSITNYDFPGVGTLHLVAADYRGELRGAQGNGPFVLVLEEPSGQLSIVSPEDMAGNSFDFNNSDTCTTYWHDGGGDFDTVTYQWDSHAFKELEHKTTHIEASTDPADSPAD